jgi:hypothetical protein
MSSVEERMQELLQRAELAEAAAANALQQSANDHAARIAAEVALQRVQASLEMMPFEEQRIAALEVFRNFSRGICMHGLLKALMQSGKTGGYQYLIRLMFEAKMIDQAYILCGSNETELRDQYLADVQEWHRQAPYGDAIHVVFRQDCDKTTMITVRTLIVNDESRLVSSQKQTLHRFLTRHGLSMSGTMVSMVQHSTYILSVDATPYAEEAAIVWNESNPKFIVKQLPGEGYYGVEDYLRDGHIREAFNVKTPEGKAQFVALLTDPRNANKFNLIRNHHSDREYTASLHECFRQAGCVVLSYNSKFKKGNRQIVMKRQEAAAYRREYGRDIPCLETAPTQTTVVLIDGRLRCGKRVCKDHIGFVWESSRYAKTDTILQSLLGRMCGYDVPAIKPLIFVPLCILRKRERRKVLQQSEIQRAVDPRMVLVNNTEVSLMLPFQGTHLVPGSIQNIAERDGIRVYPCVPIRIFLNPAELEEPKFHTLAKLEREQGHLLQRNQNLTAAQKDEILSWLRENTAEARERFSHIRNYQVNAEERDSNQGMHKCHVNAYQEDTASSQHISDFHFITICVTRPGFEAVRGVRSTPGEVFVIFYTKAVGLMAVIPQTSRIPRTTGHSHFSVAAELSEVREMPAGSVYGFSPAIHRDPAVFQTEFRHFITTAQQGIGVFGRRFHALRNGESIYFPRNVYGGNLERMKEIFAELERECGVTITYRLKNRAPIVMDDDDDNDNVRPLPPHEIRWIEWN